MVNVYGRTPEQIEADSPYGGGTGSGYGGYSSNNNPNQRTYRISPEQAEMEMQEARRVQAERDRNPALNRQQFDPRSAAGIAADVARTGGTVNPYLAERARQQGYRGEMRVERGTGREIVEPSYIPGDNGLRPSLSSTTEYVPGGRTYTPYGDLAQTEILKTKNVINPLTGEIATYQLRPNHAGTHPWDWQLVSMGGRNAAQSGMFSVNEPLTPVVYTQESGGTKFSDRANVGMAGKILANPKGYSRLGAELYGGRVEPLDGRLLDQPLPERTITATNPVTGVTKQVYQPRIDRVSSYADKNNLATYAEPLGVNLSKREAPGSPIPYGVPGNLPLVSTMNEKGLVKTQDIRGSSGRLVGGNKVATSTQVLGVGTTKVIPVNQRAGTKYTDLSTTGGSTPKFKTLKEATDYALKDVPETSTYRPSDQSMWLREQGGDMNNPIAVGLIKASDFFFPGSVEKSRTATKPIEIDPALIKQGGVDYHRGFIDPATGKETMIMDWYEKENGELTTVAEEGKKIPVGEAYPVGAPVITTRYNPDTGMDETIAEQAYQQDYKQNRTTVDLSKVSITPQEKRIVAAPSGFEYGESRFAEQVTKKIMPEIKQESLPKTSLVFDTGAKATQFAAGVYSGVREKPLTAGVNVGVGIGISALTLGIVNPATSSFATGAITSGSRAAIPAAALNFGVTKVAPAALVTLYGADFARTSTNNFEDYSEKMYYRAGERFGYETGPLIVGGGIYSKANSRLSLSESNYQAALQEGTAKGRVDYFKQSVKSSRLLQDYYQVKAEALSQGKQAKFTMEGETKSGWTPEKKLANIERIKANDLKAQRGSTKIYERTIPPEQTANIPEFKVGSKNVAPAEPALGRNFNGEIEFGPTDYVRYKVGKFAAETRGRLDVNLWRDVAPEPTTLKSPQSDVVYLKDSLGRPILNAKGKPIAQKLGAGEVSGETFTNEAYFNRAGEIAYPKAKGKTVLEYNRPATPEKLLVQPENEYAYTIKNEAKLAASNKPASLEPNNYASTSYTKTDLGIQRVTSDAYYEGLVEPAYGARRPLKETTLDFLIKAGGLTEELGARGWKGFGTEKGATAPKATTGKYPGAPDSGTAKVGGMRIVGGKSTPALSREPSLKSMGIRESASLSPGGTTGIKDMGQRIDFRTQPRGSMKPFTKMAGGQGILSEELPVVEGATARSGYRYSSSGVVGVTRPQLEFRQDRRQSEMSEFASASILSSGITSRIRSDQRSRQRSDSDILQGMRRASVTEEMQTQASRRKLGSMPVTASVSSIAQGQKPRSDILQGMIPASRIGLDSRSGLRIDQSFRQDQRQRQETRQIQDQWQIQRPVTTTIPPVSLSGFGGGQSGYDRRVGRGRRITQRFTVDFGDVSGPLFGRGAAAAVRVKRVAKAAPRKVKKKQKRK